MQSFLLLICMIHTGHDFGPKPRNSELIQMNHIPVICHILSEQSVYT